MSNNLKLVVEVDIEFKEILDEWKEKCREKGFTHRSRIMPMVEQDLKTLRSMK